jgi:glycosyltransferase 2 family protein
MGSMKTRVQPKSKRWQWFYLLVCALGLYVVVPQLGSFHDSFQHLGDVRLRFVYGAIGFSMLTWVCAATTYYLLAVRPLMYRRTVLVQAATTFVNRLLPAGIGGIGANYAYLRKGRHTRVQAATVVAVNNSLGFIGHGLLLSGLILSTPLSLRSLQLPHLGHGILAVIVVAVILLIIVLTRRGLRYKFRQDIGAFIRQLALYKRRRLRLGAALLSSLCLTFANVCCLWFSVLAVHGSLGLIPVLLVFTFGLAVGTITPTPGGIGGIEAGLLAGLVAYHLDASVALAAVLLYRLVSFWLMLALGGLAFTYVQRHDYL